MKGREFRGGLDEKMKIMWLGGEIVLACLPPLVKQLRKIAIFQQQREVTNNLHFL